MGSKELHYDQQGKDPDLASQMLLSVTRHLLTHVPAEAFGSTVKWACYSIGYQACRISRIKGTFPRQIIPVGKENGVHPGDTLHTLYEDWGTVKHRHDWLMSTVDESIPTLVVHGLPNHHRHVYLTAEVLITMRQALDTPALSTDDHLKFQGLDATAGEQMMEVLGSEMDHRLPSNLPTAHGSVAAIAAEIATLLGEIKPE